MLDAGRRGRVSDRAAHPGLRQRRLAGLAAGQAFGSLEPRRQRLGIGDEGDALIADAHLSDDKGLSSVGANAFFESSADRS